MPFIQAVNPAKEISGRRRPNVVPYQAVNYAEKKRKKRYDAISTSSVATLNDYFFLFIITKLVIKKPNKKKNALNTNGRSE